MARGVKKEVVYTGKALKIHEEIVALEAKLKTLKEELKIAHKEEVKKIKEEERKAQIAADAAVKKELEKKKKDLIIALKTSGKSLDEVIEMLNNGE